MDETRIEEMIDRAISEADRAGMARGIVWTVCMSIGFLVAGLMIGYILGAA